MMADVVISFVTNKQDKKKKKQIGLKTQNLIYVFLKLRVKKEKTERLKGRDKRQKQRNNSN